MSCCYVEKCTLDAVRPRSAPTLCEKHYRIDCDARAPRCKVDGCERAGNGGNGYCTMHRARERLHGKITNTRPKDWGSHSRHPLWVSWKHHRRVTKDHNSKGLCKDWFDDFWAFADGVGERPEHCVLKRVDETRRLGPDNFHWKVTVSSKDKAEYARRWKKDNPDKDWKNNQRKRFKRQGMTPEQLSVLNDRLDDLWLKTDGPCDCCGNKETSFDPRNQRPFRLAIDHCHKTGKLRGMLCVSCNTILGHFEKDPVRVQKIIEFGRSHSAF